MQSVPITTNVHGKIKQHWTIEETSVFRNSGHLEWRAGLSHTISKETHPRTISFRFGLIWFHVREEDLNVKVYGVQRVTDAMEISSVAIPTFFSMPSITVFKIQKDPLTTTSVIACKPFSLQTEDDNSAIT